MIRYANHTYVALTSEQKESKKDYLLEQEMQKPHEVPTWEDILEEHNELMESTVLDYFDPDRHNLTGRLTERLEQYGYDADDEDAREHFRDEVVEELFQEQVYKTFYPEYEKAVQRLKQIDGADCWRDLVIPASVDPATLVGIGRYWALDEEAAQALEADIPHDPYKTHEDIEQGYRYVQFHGRVPGQYIDPSVVLANMYGTIMKVEADAEEVRFFRHTPIFIYDIVVWNNAHGLGKSEMIEIEDYRRC